uniref:Uncharacterized protein n=1 Tax=Knipowitschia caucasica TaxID=637954 RepID=A0AAV2LZY7_KNICA
MLRFGSVSRERVAGIRAHPPVERRRSSRLCGSGGRGSAHTARSAPYHAFSRRLLYELQSMVSNMIRSD